MMMDDGYYECDVCPRWFKVVEGEEVELKMPRDAQEILSNNIVLLKKGECPHVKLRNDIKESKVNFNKRRSVQDMSRFECYYSIR
jgi:hypothetical protein